MPGQDETGPVGQEAMTRRGLGPCDRGMRRGFGRGFGWRCLGKYSYATPVILSKEEERKILETELKEIEFEKQDIETEKQGIEKRLKELK